MADIKRNIKESIVVSKLIKSNFRFYFTSEKFEYNDQKKDKQSNGQKKDKQSNGQKKDRQSNDQKKDRQSNDQKKDRQSNDQKNKKTMIYKLPHRKLKIERNEHR